jgi:tRNA (guanine-N7-)-methyltransferase
MNDTAQRRTVRSFVRRAGRMTRAQTRALEELWPHHGIHWEPAPLDLDALFGRRAPRVLEIGFGTGTALVQQALDHPERDLLGIEVHEPGVGHCLLEIERLGLTNVRLACHDAIAVLRDRLPAGSLHGVQLFFPDPWPKKRHHKRRIVQPGFIGLVARVLEPGGFLHMATDWPPYAEHMQAVLAAQQLLLPDPDARPERARTRFEARGERLGHPIWDGIWRRAG